jgi:hypothetical protein
VAFFFVSWRREARRLRGVRRDSKGSAYRPNPLRIAQLLPQGGSAPAGAARSAISSNQHCYTSAWNTKAGRPAAISFCSVRWKKLIPNKCNKYNSFQN